MSVTRHIGEIVVALALLAIGAAAVVFAWGMPAGTIAQPGPRVHPTAVGVCLMIFALGTLVLAIADRKPQAPVDLGHRDAALTVAMLVFAAAAFERIGAFATFSIFLLALLRLLARLPWWQAAGAGLAIAAATWWVFGTVLGVVLPGLPF